MIITLGHRQLEAVKAVATPRHWHFIDAHLERLGKNRYEAAMPAAAWRALAALLSEQAFNKRGEWKSSRPGYGAALRRIAHDLLVLERHPGYAKQLMVMPDDKARILVGFDTGPGKPAGPYPVHPGRDTLLVFEPRETFVTVDLGAGAVRSPGVYWESRIPRPGDEVRCLFLDVADHRGWDSVVPVGAGL